MTELTATGRKDRLTEEERLTERISHPTTRNIWLAVLSGVAVIMFNAMPVFLGAAGDTLGWSSVELGGLVSAYFAGNTVTYLIVGFTVNRLNWVLCARVAAIIAASIFASMAWGVEPELYPHMLFLAGMCAGTLYVFAMTALLCGERPARNMGLGFLFQLLFGAVAVYVFPVVVTPQWGLDGVLVSFAILFAVATLLTGALHGHRDEEGSKRIAMELKLKPLFCLLGMVIFFTGMVASWAFMERLGDSAGFSKEFVGTVLAASLFAGGLASLLTMFLDDRFGYRLPISVAAVLAASALIGLGVDINMVSYAVGVLLFQFSWAFGVNYIAASIGHQDTTGRYAAFLPTSMGIASMIGPAAGGFLISGDVIPLIIMGCGGALITMMIFNVLYSRRFAG